MVLPKRKLGIGSDETAEILDLRILPEKIASLIDERRFFPGWHMNKKSWYTILLDESVSSEELFMRIDESRSLAKKAK